MQTEVNREERRIECARRSLTAAVEHMGKGDFRTAGALFRAAGRYMEEIGERAAYDSVVPFPLAFSRGTSGGSFAQEWG